MRWRFQTFTFSSCYSWNLPLRCHPSKQLRSIQHQHTQQVQCLSCWMYAPLTLDFRNRAPHTYRIADGVSKVKAGACTSSVIPSGHMLNRCFHTSPKKRSKHDAPCYVITALHLKNNTRINQKRATPITHPGSLLNSDDSTEHTTMMHPDNFIYKFIRSDSTLLVQPNKWKIQEHIHTHVMQMTRLSKEIAPWHLSIKGRHSFWYSGSPPPPRTQ